MMMKKTNKVYALEKSPLYRLRNRKKLAQILQVDEKYFYKKRTYKYYNSIIPKENGGYRLISKPPKKLKMMQSRIHILLQRIETPDWVKSGKKNESHITNGLFHIDSRYARMMDISDYYNFVKRNRVLSLFEDIFQMPNDIATIMVNLVMDGNRLPTGAPSSQLVAFWAYKEMFTRINEVAQNKNCSFSLYVDDMTFSSNDPIPYAFREEIATILNEYGLHAKRKKDKSYGPADYKIITGCAIKNGKLLLKNKHRIEIINLRKEFEKKPDNKKAQKLIGKIQAARQIEPDIFPSINVSRIRNDLKK